VVEKTRRVGDSSPYSTIEDECSHLGGDFERCIPKGECNPPMMRYEDILPMQ
tara:strand:- start:479 stop:634 length:156 start_codon:yes stop_codon:yes gene_type:complete